MAHSLFQTAQFLPITSQIRTNNPIRTKPTPPNLGFPHWSKPQKKRLTITLVSPNTFSLSSSSSDNGGGESISHLERCFVTAPLLCVGPTTTTTTTTMKGGSGGGGGQYGAFGAVTLEKSKLDMSRKQNRISPELATGGGGGDIGNKINHGGGDGGDDGGDDDDYYDDFDDGDEGDESALFRRRNIFQEIFDRKFVDAVLNEWQKTVMDLPAGFRQAYEMGLVSSAQMVRFLAIHARPTTVRAISRALPQSISRAFIGRMIADPSFLYKLLLEQATTIGFSAWWELKNRKDRIKQEWDLALVNVLTAATCNAVVVWSLAPCRSYGNTFRFDLQNTLQKLPNNVFETSYPLREFNLNKRLHSFFFKATKLCVAGLAAGAMQGGVATLCAKKKDERLSVTIPSVKSNALGTGAFLGIYANLRYQLLCGLDKGLTNYFDVIGVALFFSTALRVLNVQIGETSRLAWLGIEPDPLVQSDNLMKVYNRRSEASNISKQHEPSWFIYKNAIVSGLGLLGLPQVNGADSNRESDPPKPRRKRVVRKKVTTTT